MQIIDGKLMAARLKEEIATEVKTMADAGERPPHLVAVIVGHDGGSEAYVANKEKNCQAVGFKSTNLRFDESITEEELLAEIKKLNEDDNVDGIIIQLPLPRHIDAQKVNEALDYHKDVDGFHPINVGRMSLGLPSFRPATPSGIIELLRRYEIPTKGKHVVVLGRSNIVGKPIATMLMQKAYPGDCTVTVCHSASPDIKEQCLKADIIVSALGVPGFVKKDMVKPGAIVIDVGTTRVADPTRKSGSRLAGDVDFEEVSPLCEWITPVPGGVGPMTNCILMKNTLAARKRQFPQ
ncbi:MAG: bifunctional 5,10-methylene-tetrahydrofolate dehydrogenase/5,10-methylene-tetrahydrofolate cyclohydrolase [Muribaculaceae bacterium]|nr:bifunctional 5,10-methylene-tetrahydrofolate dehydrogenase/5,10-methylene-tetrahydrofolate cyclohydrolase [Muribaculaceae bacterium]MDE6559023.1 bifunctional 5,10-methylene-tetrahydrofolate dehydrogenase/5,10-methylene-tetrahydrofolate cyclohydrolase [Muribaculaceae bacterium]